MTYLIETYKSYFTDKRFVSTFSVALVLFVASLFVNFYAGIYATENVSNSVTDMFLSNVRVFNVEDIFVYGTFVFWWFVLILGFLKPQRFPFALKSIALFTLIRSVFITLTHLGPFPNQIIIDPASILNEFVFGGDLFFSGHTGLPFLLALIFWDNKNLRVIFLISSVIFGLTVLLGHLHYSIDVLSAFFITYSIYHIALFLWPEDKNLFIHGLEPV